MDYNQFENPSLVERFLDYCYYSVVVVVVVVVVVGVVVVVEIPSHGLHPV